MPDIHELNYDRGAYIEHPSRQRKFFRGACLERQLRSGYMCTPNHLQDALSRFPNPFVKGGTVADKRGDLMAWEREPSFLNPRGNNKQEERQTSKHCVVNRVEQLLIDARKGEGELVTGYEARGDTIFTENYIVVKDPATSDGKVVAERITYTPWPKRSLVVYRPVVTHRVSGLSGSFDYMEEDGKLVSMEVTEFQLGQHARISLLVYMLGVNYGAAFVDEKGTDSRLASRVRTFLGL